MGWGCDRVMEGPSENSDFTLTSCRAQAGSGREACLALVYPEQQSVSVSKFPKSPAWQWNSGNTRGNWQSGGCLEARVPFCKIHRIILLPSFLQTEKIEL